MISTQQLREKEVISITDGRSLGYISDVEIDLSRGRVEAPVVPGRRGFWGVFSQSEEYVIPWKNIHKIGEDVILAKLREEPGPGLYERQRAGGAGQRKRGKQRKKKERKKKRKDRRKGREKKKSPAERRAGKALRKRPHMKPELAPVFS